MPAPLTDWRAGQPKSARHLNQLVDRARQWENTGGNVLVERMPNGTDLWAPEDYTPFIDIRPGIIAAPPSSGLTVSPPYAWAKYARPKPGGIDTAVELELAPPPADTEAGAGFYTEPYPVLVRVVGPPGVSAAIGTEGLMVQAWDLGTEDMPARPHWLFVTAGSGTFTARVTGATQDGSNKRWAYTFVEVILTTAGYGGWTDKSGGLTGTLRNLIEDQNGASGLYGNGVNSANLTGTMDVQPIPTGTRIQVQQVPLPDGTPAYWCQYENGIDGECTA